MNKKVFVNNLLKLIFAAFLISGAAIMIAVNLIGFINGVQAGEGRIVAAEIVGSVFPICIAAAAGLLSVKTVFEVARKQETDCKFIFLFLIVAGGLSFVDAFLTMAIAGTWNAAFNWFEVFASLVVCSLAVFPAFVVKGENKDIFGFFSNLAATVYYITYFTFSYTGIADRTYMAMYSLLALAFLLVTALYGYKILLAEPRIEEEPKSEPQEAETKVEEEKKDELSPSDYAE